MVFKTFCIFLPWAKVALALEVLICRFIFKVYTLLLQWRRYLLLSKFLPLFWLLQRRGSWRGDEDCGNKGCSTAPSIGHPASLSHAVIIPSMPQSQRTTTIIHLLRANVNLNHTNPNHLNPREDMSAGQWRCISLSDT